MGTPFEITHLFICNYLCDVLWTLNLLRMSRGQKYWRWQKKKSAEEEDPPEKGLLQDQTNISENFSWVAAWISTL